MSTHPKKRKNTDYRIGQSVRADLPLAKGGSVEREGRVTGRTLRDLHVEFTRTDGSIFVMTLPPNEVRP